MSMGCGGEGGFVQAEQKSDLLVWIEVFQLGLKVCYFGHGGLLSFFPSVCFSYFLSFSVSETAHQLCTSFWLLATLQHTSPNVTRRQLTALSEAARHSPRLPPRVSIQASRLSSWGFHGCHVHMLWSLTHEECLILQLLHSALSFIRERRLLVQSNGIIRVWLRLKRSHA